MTDIPNQTSKAPRVVLFTAILSFIMAGIGALFTMLGILGLIFGNFMGMMEFINKQLINYSPDINLSAGVNFIFVVILVLGLLTFVSSLIIGLALLKAKKWAWYVQIISSVFGLLGFPVWTVMNIVILVLYFKLSVRAFFKV